MLLLTVLAPLLYLAVCANLLPAQQGTASPPRVLSAIALVLGRHGCVPGEIAFRAGNNLLEVVNRTGYNTITYHIRSAGSAAATPSVLEISRWRDESPGTIMYWSLHQVLTNSHDDGKGRQRETHSIFVVAGSML
jgi:hypothetical protein